MTFARIEKFLGRCLLFPILLLLTGCLGANYRPVVDPYMSDMSTYESDLLACQGIAREQGVAGDAAKGAVLGATVGTVLGSVLGAFVGDVGAGAALGAAYGGATGVAEGAVAGLGGQETIIKNCMVGRGYSVLK
jgi:outer membrane lipoprotein SlyB